MDNGGNKGRPEGGGGGMGTGRSSSISALSFLGLQIEVQGLQPADIGLPTGNGKKLSCTQAQLGQATGLVVA